MPSGDEVPRHARRMREGSGDLERAWTLFEVRL